jgi:demethylmenaquinone methyltransferase/2-methoxy-6-polyprenyl-1,4-benzoquinol methylase
MLFLIFLLLVVIGVILGLLLFIVATEGRYFGKRLLRWGYNRRSVAFEVRDDWELWEILIKRLNVSNSEEFLDLGTQTGHLPRLVVRKRGFSGHTVGIDWSEEMIQEARRQSRLEGTASRTRFLCRDVQEPLPFDNDSFTLVTCVTGLVTGLKTPESFFKEVQRVLKVKGRVVFRFDSQPRRPTLIRDPLWFTERLTPLGFQQTETVPWTPQHTILIFQLLEKV